MRIFIFLAICLVGLPVTVVARKDYVLLVAGSSSWMNYRHQADICHAYQIVHKNGIPDEQIIVMMYDDIAYNPQNPIQGNIINKPNGPNVYPGVLKDYTGNNVNAEVFLAVLNGDEGKIIELTGKAGKVIKSGPDDHIFIYFADHGAPGNIAMPVGPTLSAISLNQALQNMYNQKKFNKLTFYVEACESGSMFNVLLPKDINIYVVTAANPEEPSYACYYDEKRQTYLGDVFSVTWLEDTDVANVHNETLETQFQRILKRVNTSHPQQYGDLNFTKDNLDQFMASSNNTSIHIPHQQDPSDVDIMLSDAVPSEMVGIMILRKRMAAAPKSSPLQLELAKELQEMELTQFLSRDFFKQIAKFVNGDTPQGDDYNVIFNRNQDIENFDCYETALDNILDSCPKLDININAFFLQNLYVLVNLCNHYPTESVLTAVQIYTDMHPLCH